MPPVAKLDIIDNNTTIIGINMKRKETIQHVSLSTQVTNSEVKPSDDLKQLHVNIPAKLHKSFRLKVLEEGHSMNQVIEGLIKEYMSR